MQRCKISNKKLSHLLKIITNSNIKSFELCAIEAGESKTLVLSNKFFKLVSEI